MGGTVLSHEPLQLPRGKQHSSHLPLWTLRLGLVTRVTQRVGGVGSRRGEGEKWKGRLITEEHTLWRLVWILILPRPAYGMWTDS